MFSCEEASCCWCHTAASCGHVVFYQLFFINVLCFLSLKQRTYVLPCQKFRIVILAVPSYRLMTCRYLPIAIYLKNRRQKIGKLTFFVLYYLTPASLDAGSGSRLQGSFLSPVHKNVLEIFLTRDVFCFQ